MQRNLQFPADLVTFTEESLDGKLHFLSSACRKANLNYSDRIKGIESDLGTAASSKMKQFVIIFNGWKPLNYYHKPLHLGGCSSPRSASAKLELNLDSLSSCNPVLIIMFGGFNVKFKQ